MRFRLVVVSLAFVFLALCVAFGQQTPNFSGVWKADPAQSKFAGPPPASYLLIIDQDADKLTETIGTPGMHGDERTIYTYNLNGRPSNNSFHGIPIRMEKPVMEANTLRLESKVGTTPPSALNQILTLSPDGNTLTMELVNSGGEHPSDQKIVLTKQPDSVGAALRAPEETAGARFKNVQLLKDLPASQFMDTMRYFAFSVGDRCDFCHVQNNFAADDKPTKKMARTMITMVHTVNTTYFDGHNEVRCYTCHRGQHEPQSRPSFQ
jgi:hypothetical protein